MVYNRPVMELLACSAADNRDPAIIDTLSLLRSCIKNRLDSATWHELLRRLTPKLRYFIRGTLGVRRSLEAPPPEDRMFFGINQESDLMQSTIVRLVENDCAVLRRFTGDTESELFAYLAVITRSVVRDAVRRHRALKRPAATAEMERQEEEAPLAQGIRLSGFREPEEEKLLGRELMQMGRMMLKSMASGGTDRDKVIFELYFTHDLTCAQIAECKGLGLSKAGVEKTLNRLKDRLRSRISVGP